eukprot:12100740-Prorocentrum_lima.AAC.1
MRTGSWVAKTQKKHKALVLRRAQRLAESFVDLLREDGGRFMSAFAASGWRMDKTSKAFDELEI